MIKLYDYQERIVEDIGHSLSNGNRRMMVVSPCGSGKTEVLLSLVEQLLQVRDEEVWIFAHVNTIVDEIEERMSKYGIQSENIKVSTIQSGHKLEGSPTAIFIDEAHRSRANSYEQLIAKHPQALVFGFTATPEREDKKGFKNLYDEMIQGPTVKELIDNKVLAPYKAYRFKNKKADITGDFVQWYKEKGNGEPAIFYASSVKEMPKIKEMLTKEGISAEYISGKDGQEKQREVLERFKKGKIKVIINVKILGEGFNVPECSIVFMGRKTQSTTVYTQQFMRAMRKNPDNPNKVSKIVDLVGNYDVHGTVDKDVKWELLDDGLQVTHMNRKNRKLVKNSRTYNFKEEILEINPDDYNTLKDWDLMDYHEVIATFKKNNYKPGWVHYRMEKKDFQRRNPQTLPYKAIMKTLYEDYNQRNGTHLQPERRKVTVYNY